MQKSSKTISACSKQSQDLYNTCPPFACFLLFLNGFVLRRFIDMRASKRGSLSLSRAQGSLHGPKGGHESATVRLRCGPERSSARRAAVFGAHHAAGTAGVGPALPPSPEQRRVRRQSELPRRCAKPRKASRSSQHSLAEEEHDEPSPRQRGSMP